MLEKSWKTVFCHLEEVSDNLFILKKLLGITSILSIHRNLEIPKHNTKTVIRVQDEVIQGQITKRFGKYS